MKVRGKDQRTIWAEPGGGAAFIIDQTRLPHELIVKKLVTLEDAARAIAEMWVRGAPLIGVTAAYGMWLSLLEDRSDGGLERAARVLGATRPTAVNLRFCLDRVREQLRTVPTFEREARAFALASELAEEDVLQNRAIGQHGLPLLRAILPKRRVLSVLTHCNAGWLATVDYGTALAPVYAAHDAGMAVKVWVSETRPRNQGASLTAWELKEHGVPHTAIVDNAAGHLMQRGDVDVVIVGTDRTTAGGDVANKIGTYLKAVAARDCGIPFYVAAPSSSIDWSIERGDDIPIEERAAEEVTHVTGLATDGRLATVELWPSNTAASNFGFDVTPARLVAGLITERGVCEASRAGLLGLFPERRARG